MPPNRRLKDGIALHGDRQIERSAMAPAASCHIPPSGDRMGSSMVGWGSLAFYTCIFNAAVVGDEYIWFVEVISRLRLCGRIEVLQRLYR